MPKHRSIPSLFVIGLFVISFVVAAKGGAVFVEDVAEEQATVYRVGVAKIDVTPDYPIRLNGFGNRRKESEGVTQRIWVKALTIGNDEKNSAILLTLDNLGIRLPMLDEVAARLKKKAGITRDRIVLSFSHTHTAPKVNGASDNIFSQPISDAHQNNIDRYTRELTDKIEQVALEALGKQRPSHLSWNVGKVTFAKNRRTAGGPVDHDLPMLVVKSLDGNVRAIYVSYACHCVTLRDNKISGDWAGYAQQMIERQSPGAVALVAIGAGSDSNPSPGITGTNAEIAAEQGVQIAREVQRLMKGPLRSVSGKLTTRLQRIDLPLNQLPSREQFEQMAAKGGPAGYNATTQLARLARGEELLTKIDYPIQTLTFGNRLSMVFLAGEVCVDYSHRLKRELNRDRIWVNAYSNDFCSYIPSERLVREGGYGGGSEVPYFALPTTLKAGLEQLIVDEVLRQAPDSFHVKPGTQGVPPKSPADSLRCMKTHDHLQIELVAAEPLVSDPVTIDFGPDGRLWVTEMTDYARSVDEEFEPTGRIRFLEDTSGDGKYDKATMFLGGLRFPTDVKVWRDGVLVCDAPDILYAEDTTGDGKADIRRILFWGFETKNPQARVNSLRLGLDNWIYGSGGLFGGKITSFSGKTADCSSRDFRLNPETGDIEPVAGNTQQGRIRNDWGDWFGCSNGTLLRHYPLTDRYTRRNPHVAPPASAVYVPSDPNPETLFPVGELVRFKLSGAAGRPTSVCGAEIYRDDLLGESFAGNSFSCEPVNQLVHRLTLSRRGATFSGRRAPEEQSSEFLASTDRWFRPVQVRTGPDGALWVVDMYRYVIEHPRWIPRETVATLDTFAGKGLGRIYRIFPKNKRPRSETPLDGMKTPELVAALDSPNGSRRDLVQELLVWRNDRTAAAHLEQLARKGRHPQGRLHALCTLDGLGLLRDEILQAALADKHADVRRHAVRLSENRLDESPDLLNALLKMLDDSVPQVQLQLAYSLGECRDRRAADVLVQLATKFSSDRYLVAAVMSSANKQNIHDLLRTVLAESRENRSGKLLQTLLGLATTLGDRKTMAGVIETIVTVDDGNAAWRAAALGTVVDALRRRKMKLDEVIHEPVRQQLVKFLDKARRTARDDKAQTANRLAAITLLGRRLDGQAADVELLSELLVPQSPVEIQTAAVQSIASTGDTEAASALVSALPSATPQLQKQILDALLRRDAWIPKVLEAVQSGQVQPAQLDATRRSRLLTHRDESVRTLAATLFSTKDADRQPTIERYQTALETPGDRAGGKAVFIKVCATCHKLEDAGHAVGPDLAALSTKTPEALLIAILDPSRDVDARYQNYAAGTAGGKVFTGVLADETSTSITIVEPDNKRHVLLRTELEELRGTGKSAMPDGVEKDVKQQEMADLLEYLASTAPKPKTIAGNTPTTVASAEKGQLSLLATNGAIYGGDIVFEQPFQNIGYWHGENDRVSWRVQIDNPGTYDVYIDWACHDESAGNAFRIDGVDPVVRSTVVATGGWDRYRHAKVGSVSLAGGLQNITVRPDGKLRSALFDLRAVYFVPRGRSPLLALSDSASSEPDPTDPAAIARMLLDDTQSKSHREKLMADNPMHAGPIVAAMVADLRLGSADEYRRIPWIWRVSIAAGKRNDADELRRLLDVALPTTGQPLSDWRAVVIGGGIVNGISLGGVWPRARMDELLKGEPELSGRWRRSLGQAASMADNQKIRSGTRYDALRMIAMDDWKRRGTQLVKYLESEDAELQMGAVSGLADVDSTYATTVLLNSLEHLTKRNRTLALAAFVRNEIRMTSLLDAVEARRLKASDINQESIKALRSSPNGAIRRRAKQLLPHKPSRSSKP